eukprot:CAMPEP_0204864464 /NCGR_PEP_ID=MMETSP1348-20121228/4080_1 /ASSEMBLY_ACC=CAM_ASM_000700 /TAXON_ID=215587 /ORGANISM="Aplanochytrium stocchinoi, Strain GSBS06" /LENGTH=597 /DNA_ID=CAMNT_0052015109 /DNA_START=240 /DNA_END=2033 /DNA_ORIENTATION=+
MPGVKRELDGSLPKSASNTTKSEEGNNEETQKNAAAIINKPEVEVDSDSDSEALCRYCFGGREDGELISPCACKGGQKYVHLSCLRQWQRMVLVSQPTHPAFYEDDVRQHKCNVCTEKFTCPPPTRFELMSSFTGPELAALISVGCVIGSHRNFSEDLEHQIGRLPILRGNYEHWIRGSYLITSVEKDDDTVKIPINSTATLERFKHVFEEENFTLKMGDKTFKIIGEGSLKDKAPKDIKEAFMQLKAPCEIFLKSQQPYNCGDDHVTAVNLSRAIEHPPRPSMVTDTIEKIAIKYPAARDVEITHYRGGPCDPTSLVCCVVPVGHGQGWKIVRKLSDAIQLAYAHVHSESSQDEGEEESSASESKNSEFGRAQTVRLKGLKSCSELNGSLGLTLRFENGRWLVRLANGAGKKVKPENLEPLSTKNGRVMCFWGDARWSRTQLLGEIARGSWGLCAASITDIVAPVEERWNNLLARLAFAPKSAMSEEYMSRQMNLIRSSHIVPAVGAENDSSESSAGSDNPLASTSEYAETSHEMIFDADVVLDSMEPPKVDDDNPLASTSENAEGGSNETSHEMIFDADVALDSIDPPKDNDSNP